LATRTFDDRALPDATAPHETRANSVLRPIIFGATDGLVSNLALVMGVAGANPAPGIIVLAGVAGLLAGAFSMGVGEYISVQSQRELLDFQIAFQRKQLREAPEQERAILRGIYEERGFSSEHAAEFSAAVLENVELAVRLLIFEEVGLDARSIGSPLTAGLSSFVSFTLGALVPLLPYLLLGGSSIAGGATLGLTALGLSLVSLGLLGAGSATLTRRPIPFGAARQMLLGGTAAGVTFLVGSLLGATGL